MAVLLKFGPLGNAADQFLVADQEVHFFRLGEYEPVLDQGLQRVFLEIEFGGHFIRELVVELVAVKIEDIAVGAVEFIDLDFHSVDGGDGFVGAFHLATRSPGIKNSGHKGDNDHPQEDFDQRVASNVFEHELHSHRPQKDVKI